ncbi:MAG: tRNA epoxyqueuosine(34) reductase QueG [Armatimonadota bacterium]
MTEQTIRILSRAKEIGFAAAGIAAVEPMDPAPLRDWLDAGYGAEMEYLRRHLPLRGNLEAVLPDAKSVICVALPYPGPHPDEAPIGAVARYARGADYHEVVMEMLTRLWSEIHGVNPDAVGCIFVDAGPLPEREMARRAGIGWPGKHSCLISPALGSRFVLGEIFTTLPLTPSTPIDGSCGSCRHCLDACPTGALVSPGVVDARRCLSYLTIEHKGEIPRELRPLMGTRLFGCDSCQDACPHNQQALQSDSPLSPAADLLAPDLIAILRMTPETFNARFRGTPLARAKRRGILRNACIVLGNLGDPAAIPALRHALHDHEPLIRAHAAWALGQLGATDILVEALDVELDELVRAEILVALRENKSICR